MQMDLVKFYDNKGEKQDVGLFGITKDNKPLGCSR